MVQPTVMGKDTIASGMKDNACRHVHTHTHLPKCLQLGALSLLDTTTSVPAIAAPSLGLTQRQWRLPPAAGWHCSGLKLPSEVQSNSEFPWLAITHGPVAANL